MGKEKVHINIVVIGHPHSGKSTIVNHLIDKLGGIDKSVIERFDIEPPEISNKHAWVLDKLKAQRERGITTLCMFETTKYYCTVINAPRHMNFFKNSMSEADCVVLVIDSTSSGFETGLSKGDQTLQHILLASVLGVKQMICCCNKMDATTPKYSRDRFKETRKTSSPFLMRFGYNPGNIPFVPVSGFEGDNLIEPSTNIDWYIGPTLLETLDLIRKPTRLIKDPGAVAHAVRDRFLSLCRQLQREHRMLMEELEHLSSEGPNIMLNLSVKFLDFVMEECKCVSTKWENFRQDLLAKFQVAIMEKCKCVSTEGENFRQDLLAKFQDAIKEELIHLSSAREKVMLDLSAKFLDSVMEECKCVTTEGGNFRQDLLAKFQDEIKEVLKHSKGTNVMPDLSAEFLDSVKGENFRQDLLAKFQDAIKEELIHLSSARQKVMLDLSAKFLDSVMEECKCVSTERREKLRQDVLATFMVAIMEDLIRLSSEGQNVMLNLSAKFLDSVMEECKCVSTKWENFWQDLIAKFQYAIKDVNCRLLELKDRYLSEIEVDDMLNTLVQGAEQYAPKDGEAGFTIFPRIRGKKRKIQLATRTGSGYNTRSKGVPTFRSL